MVRDRRKKAVRRERWSKRDEQRDKHLERRGLEGRGNANVIPQSAWLPTIPPALVLVKAHSPAAPSSPSGPQLDRPLIRCSLLCARALLDLPHLNQDIPSPPVSSSHLLLSVSFPVSLPCLCLGLCSLQPPLLPLGPASHCAAGPSPLPHAQCQLYVKHETPH